MRQALSGGRNVSDATRVGATPDAGPKPDEVMAREADDWIRAGSQVNDGSYFVGADL